MYALPERGRASLPAARLVSCPGCYPTAALLSLLPLADADLLDGDVVIDAKSGVSGAGKASTDRTHFSENHGSVAAYGIFAHRHAPEMEQELRRGVTFVPHLVPLNRGILETIYGRLARVVTAADVGAALRAAYADAPFVQTVLRRDVLINRTATTVLRLLPPFVVSGEEVEQALTQLDAILTESVQEQAS